MSPRAVVLVTLVLALTRGVLPADAATGGPDGFGYRWDDTQPYAPLPSLTPVTLQLEDDDFVQVPIGFDFPFYGQTYDTLTITSNGMVHFDGETFIGFENQGLPYYDKKGPYLAASLLRGAGGRGGWLRR